jgi:hypothetical protein
MFLQDFAQLVIVVILLYKDGILLERIRKIKIFVQKKNYCEDLFDILNKNNSYNVSQLYYIQSSNFQKL